MRIEGALRLGPSFGRRLKPSFPTRYKVTNYELAEKKEEVARSLEPVGASPQADSACSFISIA